LKISRHLIIEIAQQLEWGKTKVEAQKKKILPSSFTGLRVKRKLKEKRIGSHH